MKAHHLLIALLVLGFALPARAGDPNFGSFVKQLERDYNIRRTHIPMFWLAKAAVRVARPAGVARLDFAVFEDQDLSPLSAPDLQVRVGRLLGTSWLPFVEVHAPRSGEHSLLYMREKGKDVEIFVFTVERSEAVAVLTRVNPDALMRVIDDPPSFIAGVR